MSAVTTRVRGLAPWRPHRATRDLIVAVQAVLVEYGQYLPLTVRQIFYRLVGAYGYDKTENAYSRLGEHLNRARRSGLIPFEAIRDDGVTSVGPHFWDGAAHLVGSITEEVKRFRLDRQIGQPRRLIFAVEAVGMVPQIERITDPFCIEVQSCGGFDSTTRKYNLAAKVGLWSRTEVIHIGDHDPSGVHMFSSIAEDVQTFAKDLGLDGDIQFSRLAVTPSQIAELHLPTAPAKPTDNRSFTGETVQCEAIPPDMLAAIISGAIEKRLDQYAYDLVLAREKNIQEDLVERLGPLQLDDGGAA